MNYGIYQSHSYSQAMTWCNAKKCRGSFDQHDVKTKDYYTGCLNRSCMNMVWRRHHRRRGAAPRRTMGQTYQNLFKKFFHSYWILIESLFKKGLEYSNYTWKYSSKTLDLQFFISPFLNRIQRPGPLCTVHSWTLCAYGRCLLAPRRVFIGPVLFWQRMVVCHQNSLSLPHS